MKDTFDLLNLKYLTKEDALEILDEYSSLLENELDADLQIKLKNFLKVSSHTIFLQLLVSEENLKSWSELVFKIIQKTNYSLLDLFSDRVSEIPERTLFQDMSSDIPKKWSYFKIHQLTKEIAVSLLQLANNNPRVAIYAENSVLSAACDLACLFYDIIDTPLNTNFDVHTLVEIFDELNINIVITDTIEKYRKLEAALKIVKNGFKIVVTSSNVFFDNQISFNLDELTKKLDYSKIDSVLSNRKRLPLNQVATVMFTSGSTGIPKGLCFSIYNLVAKRFARSAAVPFLGDNEVLLCYLPLFHTFGRYLEMLGTIYWRGTYVFTGNTSSETLLSLFPRINPSIFISIPLRWVQLEESAFEKMNEVEFEQSKLTAFREIVGSRLRWGLSAAGYLEPKVFMFFQRNGVDLCSGFGMTEGTGGITMTPPGKYVENSVGKPLPGISTRCNENSELEISGHYIARYLDDIGDEGIINYPQDEDYWLSTGDIFKEDENGYYEIVDRVKDIYKNNRGQTIAPKNVENKFEGVPGIKRTFLVGDGKQYNVLFIVPDFQDEEFKKLELNTLKEYYHQIITKVNQDLASYERVINFSILLRDFELEKGELTPKGSFNRKIIEKNFSEIIDSLYQKSYIELEVNSIKVRIPHWFFRDLGILEDDIYSANQFLINHRTHSKLRIEKLQENFRYLIGDLEYIIENNFIDLGLFARQPLLWIGNPQIIQFTPYKEGWDLTLKNLAENIFRPWNGVNKYQIDELPVVSKSNTNKLNEVNLLICTSLYGTDSEALDATERLGDYLALVEQKLAHIIRKRLESLARHSNEDVRCTAYKILLLDIPDVQYSKTFPAFILSGLSFLNEKTIRQIAKGKLEIRRLEALRKRLYIYRTEIELPINDFTRSQFENIFKLLFDFIKLNPEFYSPVRYEFISWMLYRKDPLLAEIADKYFRDLHIYYEQLLDTTTPKRDIELWDNRLVFDDGISKNEIRRIRKVFINTAFIKQSVHLIYDEKTFDISNTAERGVWISKLDFNLDIQHYRINVSMKDSAKYDLQLFIMEEGNLDSEIETILWHVSIAGYPFAQRVLPKFGAYRPELKAWSFAYLSELSVWDKLREFDCRVTSGESFINKNDIKKLYLQAFTVIITAWKHSGKVIVPGILSPNNITIPEHDFRAGATINSINGWKIYKAPNDLIDPIIRNFFRKVNQHYQWSKRLLDIEWLFDSFQEAFKESEALENLQLIAEYLREDDIVFDGFSLYHKLLDYINNFKNYYYSPLPLQNAITRYGEWKKINFMATNAAKDQTIDELMNLYNLDQLNEIARYVFYRNTYFKDKDIQILVKFDDLITKLYTDKEHNATQLVELSDLQAAIDNNEDREIFTKMVFPKIKKNQNIDVLKVGNKDHKIAIIQSHIKDKSGILYSFREPTGPAEIGQLYRTFFMEKFPKIINEQDEYYVLTDSQERIVGGICYRIVDEKIILIDGTVVIHSLKTRGLGSAMIEDFCDRMANRSFEVVKTHFFMQNFYLERGFEINEKWGALVRFLKNG